MATIRRFARWFWRPFDHHNPQYACPAHGYDARIVRFVLVGALAAGIVVIATVAEGLTHSRVPQVVVYVFMGAAAALGLWIAWLAVMQPLGNAHMCSCDDQKKKKKEA